MRNITSLKVTVISWLEFDLANYNVSVQHITHYTMETSSKRFFYHHIIVPQNYI